MLTPQCITVAVRGRSEVIQIFYHELPEDPSDVIEVLRAELAPLETWCEFALAYDAQGLTNQCCPYQCDSSLVHLF